MLIYLLFLAGLFSRDTYEELNIKGIVEKPKTIYILQRSEISKQILKQRFSFKDAAEQAISDPILKEN